MEKQIWSLWWQGEENAPPPVRLCLASIRRNANGAKVTVLDKDTYRQYVTLPAYILEKFDKGAISRTHLSDLIRMRLLRDYGGLWVDCTVYVNSPIPDEVFSRDLYSLKQFPPPGQAEVIPAHGEWSSFLVGGTKGMLLFKAMSNTFDIYWKENESLIDYLLIDYVFEMITEMSQTLHDAVASIPVYDGYYWDFAQRCNEVVELNELNGLFQKMSYKFTYKAYVGDKVTLYGKALQAYGLPLEEYAPGTGVTNAGVIQKLGTRFGTESERIARMLGERLAYVADFPRICREFGARIALWELLFSYLGLLNRRFRYYLKRHLDRAIKDRMRETVRRALAEAEDSING